VGLFIKITVYDSALLSVYKALVRIPVLGRGKSGKTPGWEQVNKYTNKLSEILEEFLTGEEGYPGKLLLGNMNIN
jgi:hypothetical protein